MPIAFDVADKIFREEKRLLGPLMWRSVESKKQNEQRRCLECLVEINGGSPRGVHFRIIVFPGSLARATFQLECDLPKLKKHAALYRLELGPRRPHMNQLFGPEELWGMFIEAGQTHEHLFYDSLRDDGSLRDNPCVQARLVLPPPTDFNTAFSYVCTKINIVNGGDIPSPGDQGLLL